MTMEGGASAPTRREHAALAAAQRRSRALADAQGAADKIHARFSPSAANRRIHCPPSLLLEEQFEEGESVYAAEGTAGHALAEHLIRKYLGQHTVHPTSEFYTDELLAAVDEYVSFVTGEIEDACRECKSPLLLVEQCVDVSEYVEGCFYSADMVIITDKTAHIINLKLGKGVEVHAEENPQLMIYGLGILHMAEALYDIETVRLTIFQPRLNNSSTWDVSPEYLTNRTGRWAGRLVQVQNLPQNHLPDLALARDLVKAGRYEDIEALYESTPGVLSELIRTAFVPRPGCRFIVADFSAIEARVIAWLSGEQCG